MAKGITLGELAKMLGAEVQGDAGCQIQRLNTLQDAGEGELAFLANSRYCSQLAATRASAVILAPADAPGFNGNKLVMDQPYLGYALASRLFDHRPSPPPGIHPSAVIAETATLSKGVSVGPFVVIEDGAHIGEGSAIGPGCFIGDHARVGKACRIAANVSIYHGVCLGDRVIAHSGAVIGADGFGFAPDGQGWTKIHQLGGVAIGDDVEIGAGTTIDRGALGDTVIGRGVILDNQVQIAHNVRVGENTAIAGCTAIAGSTRIGKNCVLAGAVGVVGHISLCDNVTVTAMSLVTRSITKPGVYSAGTPLSPNGEWRRNAARFGQLNSIAQRLQKLEKQG